VFGVYFHSPFILGIGLLCSVFDLLYIGLLGQARATERAAERTVAASAAAPGS
jgi:hypothetical protein